MVLLLRNVETEAPVFEFMAWLQRLFLAKLHDILGVRPLLGHDRHTNETTNSTNVHEKMAIDRLLFLGQEPTL